MENLTLYIKFIPLILYVVGVVFTILIIKRLIFGNPNKTDNSIKNPIVFIIGLILIILIYIIVGGYFFILSGMAFDNTDFGANGMTLMFLGINGLGLVIFVLSISSYIKRFKNK